MLYGFKDNTLDFYRNQYSHPRSPLHIIIQFLHLSSELINISTADPLIVSLLYLQTWFYRLIVSLFDSWFTRIKSFDLWNRSQNILEFFKSQHFPQPHKSLLICPLFNDSDPSRGGWYFAGLSAMSRWCFSTTFLNPLHHAPPESLIGRCRSKILLHNCFQIIPSDSKIQAIASRDPSRKRS